MVKISVYWITACSVEGTPILKMKSIIFFLYRDTKYVLEINLMEIGDSRPATLGKSYLNLYLMKLDFINMNN